MKKIKLIALMLVLTMLITGMPVLHADAEDAPVTQDTSTEDISAQQERALEEALMEALEEGQSEDQEEGQENAQGEGQSETQEGSSDQDDAQDGSSDQGGTQEGSSDQDDAQEGSSDQESESEPAEDPQVVTVSTPQSVYSVAKSIKSFNLNASGTGTLTYSSSDPAVASVSSKGVVKVRKNGTAYITITDDVSSKRVKVKVSSYKATNGRFVEAIGNIDKKSGDSTGREIRVKKYRGYKKKDHARSWTFIIRCNDPEVADKAALAVYYIAKNNHFGYVSRMHTGQKTVNKRAAIYKTVVKATGKRPSKAALKKIKSIKKKANTSCTPTCLVGYWLYYSEMSDRISLKWRPPYNKKSYKYYCGAVNVEYHQLEKAIKHVNAEYKKKGMLEPFTIIYVPANKRSSFFKKSNIRKNLKRGDIICSCPNYKKDGHSAIMM